MGYSNISLTLPDPFPVLDIGRKPTSSKQLRFAEDVTVFFRDEDTIKMHSVRLPHRHLFAWSDKPWTIGQRNDSL